MKKICVFCGASAGGSSIYAETAIELIAEFSKRGIGLVYGGAKVGLMGVLADEAIKQGVEVIGVMPQALVDREVAHQHLDQLNVVNSMHERKAMMAKKADGFIAMPGGLGTLEELFEVLTWSQLRFHRKPCGLLNVENYYSKLEGFLDHAVEQGFLKAQHRRLLIAESSAAQLLDELLTP